MTEEMNLSQFEIRELQHELLDAVHDEDAPKVRALCSMALRVRKLERELKIQDEANEILTRMLKESYLEGRGQDDRHDGGAGSSPARKAGSTPDKAHQ